MAENKEYKEYKAEGKVVTKQIKPKKKTQEERLEEMKNELDQNLGELYQDMIKMRDALNRAMERLGLEKI